MACIGIITMFLWRRLPFCYAGVEVFLQHVTVLAVHIFCYFFCFLVTDVSLRPRLEVHTG